MFQCLCGKFAFYSDEMCLLSDTVATTEQGIKYLVPIRTIKYYTCVNCDRRWIWSHDKETFVSDEDGGMI